MGGGGGGYRRTHSPSFHLHHLLRVQLFHHVCVRVGGWVGLGGGGGGGSYQRTHSPSFYLHHVLGVQLFHHGEPTEEHTASCYRRMIIPEACLSPSQTVCIPYQQASQKVATESKSDVTDGINQTPTDIDTESKSERIDGINHTHTDKESKSDMTV